MVARGRRAIAGLATLSLVVVAGFAIMRPGQAACAILPAMPLDRLADGSLADAGLSAADRHAVVEDRVAALRRIEATFGTPRATPVIVHLGTATALWPLPYNSFGSTDFLPGRTCVVLGPDGRNVDVMAHEMMHAEIADRVGFWRRWAQIPVWFDEGIAMQVDTRDAFDRPRDRAAAARGSIRKKDTAARFFVASPDQLTEHYALAKHEAARWLDRVGRANLYVRLSRIADGEDFERVRDR